MPLTGSYIKILVVCLFVTNLSTINWFRAARGEGGGRIKYQSASMVGGVFQPTVALFWQTLNLRNSTFILLHPGE